MISYTVVFGILMVAVFLVLSLYFLTGRGGFLIAGYNTLPKAQKEKYDEKALCQSMGRFLLVATVMVAVLYYGIYIQNNLLIYITVACMVLSIFGYIYYMNKGGGSRFLKK
ncbi:MAG: DUF3784 domain-containing protein [Methanimicrococcus sp.]|nr:DUF3784 domain-containing protein [Methanimicrococcus sp.]